MYESPQGLRVGLLDDLTGNTDRHFGNWMVGHGVREGDYPIPIDHGNAGRYGGGIDYGSGPFGEALIDGGADTLGRITPPEWAQMDSSLQALKADFQAEGRAEEFYKMLGTFRALRDSSDSYREGGFA
jgi:hypothetical protein